MDDQQRTRLVGWVIALMVLTVGWSLVLRLRPARAPRPSPVAPSVASPPPPRPPPTRSRAGTQMPVTESIGPGYLDLLARAEIRRRIRASYPYTYLSPIVTASSDSMLHRWDDRVGRPVRVFLGTDTVDNFQPAFLDAVRSAFGRWEQVGVPVRFDLRVDSADAEVRFAWRGQFEIDRTGQTDL
jgi:hypothetical protein